MRIRMWVRRGSPNLGALSDAQDLPISEIVFCQFGFWLEVSATFSGLAETYFRSRFGASWGYERVQRRERHPTRAPFLRLCRSNSRPRQVETAAAAAAAAANKKEKEREWPCPHLKITGFSNETDSNDRSCNRGFGFPIWSISD